MSKSPNCLKVILKANADAGQTLYNFEFSALTEMNDILYNEFFNHVRKNNLPVKMVLTGCITAPIKFWIAQPDVAPYPTTDKNPNYVRVLFNGITAKNEIASSKSVEFIVPTMVSTYVKEFVDGYNYSQMWPVSVQYVQLPKSNKNIGVELSDYSIFTNPINLKILANTDAIVQRDTYTPYLVSCTVEFWLFIDE